MSESLVGKEFWIVDESLKRVVVVDDSGGECVRYRCGEFEEPVERYDLLTLDSAIDACWESVKYWQHKVSMLVALRGVEND